MVAALRQPFDDQRLTCFKRYVQMTSETEQAVTYDCRRRSLHLSYNDAPMHEPAI
jgi:membrane-bound inhibitor of C-type lysozyme